MSNDKKTMEDVRNLIVCDTQFGWTGSTTLRLQQMLALQKRGWLAEGAENNEFDLTDAGRDVVARALQSAVQPTLADVQPGGMVRLGDAPWPEIDAILADAYSAGAEGLPFEGIARRAAVRKAVAALSAQPSPGGQGDALHDAVGRIFGCDGSLWRTRDVAAVLRDYAALAARQPVGEIDEAAVLRRAAAVLDMWEGDSNQTGYMGDFKDAQAILEVLAQNAARPPAQALNLGQIIEQIAQQWDGCSYDAVGETIDVGQAIRAAGKRLIDSQAVGNPRACAPHESPYGCGESSR
ncbi:hypothetical protein I5V12_01645 [Stenotrophomonas maltophilia]|nr:hypothetical protein [Stenotrophomonas maltophilia]